MCGMFGVSSNAARVAVTRLVADRLVESDERGLYRLGPAARPVGELVESWRRGEERMRAWNGDWLCVALTGTVERTPRRHSKRALGRLGFREGLPGVWVRPDNLAACREETLDRLAGLGLEPEADHVVARAPSPRLDARWRCELWPHDAIERTRADALADLERSLPRLERMPRHEAMVESFLLGGEAIRVLATDPLLPPEIAPADTRAALGALMQRYDEVGRRLWQPEPALRALDGGRLAS